MNGNVSRQIIRTEDHSTSIRTCAVIIIWQTNSWIASACPKWIHLNQRFAKNKNKKLGGGGWKDQWIKNIDNTLTFYSLSLSLSVSGLRYKVMKELSCTSNEGANLATPNSLHVQKAGIIYHCKVLLLEVKLRLTVKNKMFLSFIVHNHLIFYRLLPPCTNLYFWSWKTFGQPFRVLPGFVCLQPYSSQTGRKEQLCQVTPKPKVKTNHKRWLWELRLQLMARITTPP